MSEFEKIETIVRDLTSRVKKFHNGDWVTLFCSGYCYGEPGAEWWASSSYVFTKLRFTGKDPIEALANLEAALRDKENADVNLARTLGLEAAE